MGLQQTGGKAEAWGEGPFLNHSAPSEGQGRGWRLWGAECGLWGRFQQCLRGQRDTIADIMGVVFFNVLEIPCFVLQEQEACVAWYWWGGYVVATLYPKPREGGPLSSTPGARSSLVAHETYRIRDGIGRASSSLEIHWGFCGLFGGWSGFPVATTVTCRCQTYGSIPLARLQPRTLYNASWSSRGAPVAPSPQRPALTKPPQKQPSEQKGSRHLGTPNAMARRALLVAPALPEVTRAGLQGPQGELRA